MKDPLSSPGHADSKGKITLPSLSGARGSPKPAASSMRWGQLTQQCSLPLQPRSTNWSLPYAPPLCFISTSSTDYRPPTSRRGPCRFQPQTFPRGTNIIIFSFALVLQDHISTVLLWKMQFSVVIQDMSPARCGGRCERPKCGNGEKNDGKGDGRRERFLSRDVNGPSKQPGVGIPHKRSSSMESLGENLPGNDFGE